MLTLTEEDIRKLANQWHYAADDIRKKGDGASQYQLGVADTYMVASRKLQELLRISEEQFKDEQTKQELDNQHRSSNSTIVIYALLGILIPIIPFLVIIGAFREINFIIPFFYVLFLVFAASKLWQKKESIIIPIASIMIGILLIVINKWGESYFLGISQVMSVVGSQIMGAALISGLILLANKRKDKESTIMALSIFMIGLFTMLLFDIYGIDIPFLNVIKGLPGTLGFEILGAGITFILISGWIKEE
jgi:hypothetical protein